MSDVQNVRADSRTRVKAYIVENFLLGAETDIGDADSLLDAGILDSTAAVELVMFIESEFGVAVADDEISVENLDSVARICALIDRNAQQTA